MVSNAAEVRKAVRRGAPSSSRLEKARVAAMAMLFVAGFLFASWGVHVPTVQQEFHLTHGQLTSALFAVAIGSVFPMFVIGRWISYFGPRKSCFAAALLMITCCAAILQIRHFWLLLLLLSLFGFGLSALDIAANAEAASVEFAIGRPIMSSVHAMFSIGGAAGAVLGAVLLSHGLEPNMHMLFAAFTSFCILVVSLRMFLPDQPQVGRDTDSSRNRWSSGRLWMLGALAFLGLCAEGGIYDWAVIYMRDVLHATDQIARYAYASFAGGIAVGRLGGEIVRRRLGALRLVSCSAGLATVAICAALASPFALLSLVSFATLGLGIANIMPVLFTASTRIAGVHAAEGLAHVAGLAYFGLLLGPVLIGGITQLSTLTGGLTIVAACTSLICILSVRALKQIDV
ncbi:MFS transporter [Paraburkholderia sp. EG285A]|uniref:MFS transporter n=1 Tax=Paraburkholderia sp. EG285A TaxID=3237009 RepID=UPI0034D2130F